MTEKIALQKGWHCRPSIHVTAPWGWMNDPCAPGYDPETKTYHLFYQWNPKGCEWGNMSWGHSTSTDCVRWQSASPEPSLRPDTVYDKDGVFTGCFYATGPGGEKGQLTVFYTSVCHLPFHWTKPYPRNCAGLALATSKDGGVTWSKSTHNPILDGEPEGLMVTGFRDPFIAEWPVLDEIRERSSLYGIIAGGTHDQGPTAFLYSITATDLTKWNYLGRLIDVPRGFRPSRKWNGDFGANWECTNFITLECGEHSRQFLIVCSEGGEQRDHLKDHKRPPGLPEKSSLWCLWLSGGLSKNENKVQMSYDFGGILDHGCFYAANSFYDPITQRWVVWGWLPEEDISLDRCRIKGWNGYLSLPRELSLLAIPNVTNALHTSLENITSIYIQKEADGTNSILTLGIRPLAALEKLRQGTPLSLRRLVLPTSTTTAHTTPVRSPNWEIDAIIEIKAGCKRCGFQVRHTQDVSSYTSIYFSPADEEIVVDREKSNQDESINKHNERGPHTLFSTQKDGKEAVEKLHLRIFSDGDVIEVFANDRFALSTLVYVNALEAVGISYFAEGEPGSTVFEMVDIWTGMR